MEWDVKSFGDVFPLRANLNLRSLGPLQSPTTTSYADLLPSSPYYTAEDLDSWRKLDARHSSRILRQPSKLEPVPEKSDNVRSENPQPMDSQYG
ncbi:hypothetical protein PIB30_068214 [Stylosanthes scabra]|uniref:Uncharacterized protein n=1 Tax=Stylosanthes scabra TaxID=79078 RepID=A0ABU6TNE3_9FABA|nr:hypothetical protein [Stylosanthes scabra]